MLKRKLSRISFESIKLGNK